MRDELKNAALQLANIAVSLQDLRAALEAAEAEYDQAAERYRALWASIPELAHPKFVSCPSIFQIPDTERFFIVSIRDEEKTTCMSALKFFD
jgi:hypothetical protein